MPALALSLWAAAVLPLPADPKFAASVKELKALQGTWSIVSIEKRGTVYDLTEPSFDMTIAGNRMTVPGAPGRTTLLTPDPSADPKLLDLFFVWQWVTAESIYEVKGDTLRMCYCLGATRERNRPTSFSTKDNPQYEVRVYKRAAK